MIDGSVPDKVIKMWIDQSYDLVAKKDPSTRKGGKKKWTANQIEAIRLHLLDFSDYNG